MPPCIDTEETIVVKGSSGWSNLSSPVDSPVSQTRTEDIPQILKGTPKAQLSSTRETPNNIRKSRQIATTMEERLVAMPEQRSLPWRAGVEPGSEVETGGDSRRKQIRFGCLLATRGNVVPIPCNSCANGRGKFSICVALEGFFKGACASCQLSGRPNKCSIKQIDDAIPSPKIETPLAKAEAKHEPKRTSTGPPSSKRRRINDVPEPEKTGPQWDQELGDSHARQQMKDISQNQRSWATVNSTSTPPATVPQKAKDWSNDGLPRAAMGWAAVNQIVPGPMNQIVPAPITLPVPIPAPRIPNNAASHVPKESVNGSRSHFRQEFRDEDTPSTTRTSAVYDMLPKSKQRQVLQAVNGLQGGIDHLQRELTTLKKLLGIDEEF